MSIITVKAFKEKIQVGQKVRSELYWPDSITGELQLRLGHLKREIISKNTVGFTMLTWDERSGKFVRSESFWPKKGEVEQINETTFSITTLYNGKEDTRLIYEIL